MVLKLKGQKINLSTQTAQTLTQNPTIGSQSIKRTIRPGLQKVVLEPVILTNDLTEDLIVHVERGLNFEVAALACKVGLRQFQEWLSMGLGMQMKLEDATEPLEVSEHAARCYHLFVRMRSAKAGLLERALMELLASSDWKSKAWFLEKTGGEYFAKKETVKIEMSHIPMADTDMDFERLSETERQTMLALLSRMQGELTPKLLSATVVENGDNGGIGGDGSEDDPS